MPTYINVTDGRTDRRTTYNSNTIIKWLETFKNMIKVYDVSSKYIMLFMHNKYNRYLTFNWFTYFVAVNYTACTQKHREISDFWNISEIFHEIFHAEKFHEILHH